VVDRPFAWLGRDRRWSTEDEHLPATWLAGSLNDPVADTI
jgi:hypothetical protein